MSGAWKHAKQRSDEEKMDIESTAELEGHVSLYCILGTIERYNFIQGQVNRVPLQKVFQEQVQNRIVRL